MGSALTTHRLLSANVRRVPTKLAIIGERRQLTYEQLQARSNRVANAAMQSGLRKGDRVAVLLNNREEWSEILFGLGSCGIVTVPVNTRFVTSESEYLLEHSNAQALIFGSDFSEMVGDLTLKFPLSPCVAVGRPPEMFPVATVDYEDWLGAVSEADPRVDVQEDDMWYLGYTSGTTGFPKGTIITHRTRVLTSCYGALEFGIGPNDVCLVVMPLFHSNGIGFQLLQLGVGGTVVIQEKFDPDRVFSGIELHGITMASLVPTMYVDMLNAEEARNRHDLRSMRVFISSSAPLHTQTKEGIVQGFPGSVLNEFYGSTEGGFVTNLRPHDQMRKVRSVGEPCTGVEVHLGPPEEEEVGDGEVGELYSRGPAHVSEGYLNDPENTERSFRPGGWFTAGDMARRDDEGYLYLVDRKNDMIITGGENVYPSEVEEILITHPAVAEVAVVGVPDERWGERITGIVKLRANAEATDTELMEWCRSRLAGYKTPRAIDFWPELPRNPTGKILRRKIRETFWSTSDVNI